MYLVSVDFSKNSLLVEQLNIQSFYELPVFNQTLIEYQLKNFSEGFTEGFYLTNTDIKTDNKLYKSDSVDKEKLYKKLLTFDKKEYIVLFRNDVYFECDIYPYLNKASAEELVGLKSENDVCFAIICSVKILIKLLNMNIEIVDIFKNWEKYLSLSVVCDGYTVQLNTVKQYKRVLFNILNGKTIYKPPYIAEGVFTNGNVPKGDFSIIPPVYFGNNVQIESGTTVGANTVIYDNTLVSRESIIKNSILFKNTYVSSNCYVDGVVCCENSSVKRNSAIFPGSVIGENSLVGEDMLVSNNSIIKKNVNYDKYIKSPFTNKIQNFLENKFRGLSPEKAALLGSSVAMALNKPKILIASDGTTNSLAIKLALISGLMSAGAQCFDIGSTFKSMMFFSSLFCECTHSIFVSGNNAGTDIEIYDEKNELLSKADCYNIFAYCNEGKFEFVNSDECKSVRQIKGLRKMYIREITSLFDKSITFDPIVNCNNPLLSKIIEDVFNKMANCSDSKHKLIVNMNDSGTNVTIKFNNKTYSDKLLKKLIFFYIKSARNSGGYDYGILEKLWKYDSVVLLFLVLAVSIKEKESIENLISALPDFYISIKSFDKHENSGVIARKIGELDEFYYKDNSYNFQLNKTFIKVTDNPDSKKRKVICASEKLEVSRELCNFLTEYLSDT